MGGLEELSVGKGEYANIACVYGKKKVFVCYIC